MDWVREVWPRNRILGTGTDRMVWLASDVLSCRVRERDVVGCYLLLVVEVSSLFACHGEHIFLLVVDTGAVVILGRRSSGLF